MDGYPIIPIDPPIFLRLPCRFWLAPWLFCCLLVSGCENLPSNDSARQGAPQPAQLSNALENDIQMLLREAQIAFQDHRLTTPVENNAWYRYLRVLTLDPGNKRAIQGISDLVEKYLEWALEDMETGNVRKARNNIARARTIDDGHPNLPAVEQRLAEKLAETEQLVELQTSDLDSRSPLLAQQLLELGGYIQSRNGMVVIVARSDAEGRWIYQQLNRADPDNRIRAQIRIENRPYLRIEASR